MKKDLKDVLDKYFDTRFAGKSFARIQYAELKSVNPVTFIPEDDPELVIKGKFLVIPKHRPFRAGEIGKKFVLISNDDGQTWFYLYEATKPQGINGVPYHWEGKHQFENGEFEFTNATVECELHGTCPHGPVVVTHGVINLCSGHMDWYDGDIERCTHEQNDNCRGGGCSANDDCNGGNSCAGSCSGCKSMCDKQNSCPAGDRCSSGPMCPGDCDGAEELRGLGLI